MSDAGGVWFMRARGRILGPFTWSQLQSLRDRGQLAQFHEVSQDKQTWLGAANLGELFGSQAASGPTTVGMGLKSTTTLTVPAYQWFAKGIAGTPVSLVLEQVPALLRSGEILADTLIWREGLAGWLPLGDIPELACLVALSPKLESGWPRPIGRILKSRVFVFCAAGVILFMAAATVFLVNKYRTGELQLASLLQTSHIDSHMSADIPQATGLVVSSATVTEFEDRERDRYPRKQGDFFRPQSEGVFAH